MEEKKTGRFNLSSFRKAQEEMIATNDAAYDNGWGAIGSRRRSKDYTLEEIERIINSDSILEQQRLSRTFFYKGGYYKRILLHYATLLKYVGVVIPRPSFGKSLSTTRIAKKYHKAVEFVEGISVETFFTNCALRTLIDGCYYGIIKTMNKDRLTILDLPARYCTTRFKDTQGNDIIEFNLDYFNTFFTEREQKSILEVYPKFISDAYEQYKRGKRSLKWIFIPADVGVCFPFFDNRPLFLSTIPSTILLEETIEIERERDLEEIRKILVQKIPHLTSGELLFEPDEAEMMHKGAVEMMKKNKNISVLTTYADVDAVVSKTASDASRNSIEKMLQNVYQETGVSSQLFASTGSATLDTSLKNDLALMMYLAGKFANFITNTINTLFSDRNISFKYQILPVSYYNEEKYIDRAFKMASSGYSFLYPAIAMGISQQDLGNIKDLENDVLNLAEKLKPLSSSYTQSAADSPGAPPKEQEEKAEKTIENEESMDNTAGGTKT